MTAIVRFGVRACADPIKTKTSGTENLIHILAFFAPRRQRRLIGYDGTCCRDSPSIHFGPTGACYQLFREYLREVVEAFELESVPARIEEEHRCLLADLAGEADLWFDDKLYAF